MTRDIYGLSSLKPLAIFDPLSSYWRTSPPTSGGDSTSFSRTLPKSGMTRDGLLYARPTPERPTAGSGSSLSLKTPTGQLGTNGGPQHPDKRKSGGHGPTLEDEICFLLPTPAARDYRSGMSNIMDRNSRPLNEVIVNLLPTVKASDGTNGGLNMRGSSGDPGLPAIAVRVSRAGETTPGLSNGGSASSGVPLPSPPSPEPGELAC